MIENQPLLKQLQALIPQKKSREFYAKKLNITVQEVNELFVRLKQKETTDTLQDLDDHERSQEINFDKGILKSTAIVDFEPKTVQELAKLHKIDLDKYRISNYWSKLSKTGKFTSSILASLKKPSDYTEKDFVKFLKDWKPNIKPVFSSPKNFSLEEVDVELNIADFHLAKKTIQNDTLESKEFDYLNTVHDLLDKITRNFRIRKLVFPISNDFFHTDTYQNTTTNGTPQDVMAFYNEEYEKGFEILANAINYISTQAKQIEIILVQGNHDRTKGYYVTHALEVFFKEYKNIKFQRHHSVTKFTVLGDTFIGYHHGNNCKLDGLPLMFATSPESSFQFGIAKYREIHTGDKHHYMAKEINGSGVRVQQMPSLSGTDRWHLDNGFINQIRAGLALVYHPTKGKVAEFEHRI